MSSLQSNGQQKKLLLNKLQITNMNDNNNKTRMAIFTTTKAQGLS